MRQSSDGRPSQLSTDVSHTIIPKDNIIVVMGPTGSGKSTFIDIATGQDGHTVGHGLESETSDIRAVRVKHPTTGDPVILVDTPGFDDSFKSDVEILTTIAEWLVKTYKGHLNLAKILYLHRIIDNRMSGSLLKNLQLFKSLCGQQAMLNVVIVTTMWSRDRGVEGKDREKGLKDRYWADMMAQGCTVKRFQDTYASAWHIIGHPAAAEINSANVRLSHEMVDRRLQLKQTQAGITLNDELKKLLKARKEAARKLKAQMKRQDNELVVQQLHQEQMEIDEKINKTAFQLKELKIPLVSQLLALFKGGQ